MTPRTKDKYVGIEIECFSKKTRDECRAIVNQIKMKGVIECGADGSVSCNCKSKYEMYLHEDYYRGLVQDRRRVPCGCNSHEFRVLTKEKDLGKNLVKVGNFLKLIEAKVNKTCGLHVHLDMRTRNPIDCAQKLFNIQPIMMKAVAKSRLRNSYCKPVKDMVKVIMNGFHDDGGKYSAINIGSYEDLKTIEVRIHEGSVDSDEIYNWCKFLIESLDKDTDKPTKDIKIFSKPVKEYLAKRIG